MTNITEADKGDCDYYDDWGGWDEQGSQAFAMVTLVTRMTRVGWRR